MIREMLESLKEKNEMMWSIIILAGVGAGLGGFFICMTNSVKSTSIWLTIGWAVIMTGFVLLFLYVMDVAFKQWHKDQRKKRAAMPPSELQLLVNDMSAKKNDAKYLTWGRKVLFKENIPGNRTILKIKNYQGKPVGVYIDDEEILFIELEESTAGVNDINAPPAV